MPPAIKIIGFLLAFNLSFTNGDYSDVLSSIYNKASQNRRPLVLVLDNTNRKGSKNYYQSSLKDYRKPSDTNDDHRPININDYRRPSDWSDPSNHDSSASRNSWSSHLSGSYNPRHSNDYRKPSDSGESHDKDTYNRQKELNYDRRPRDSDDQRPHVINNRESSNIYHSSSSIKGDLSSLNEYLQQISQRLNRQKLLRKRSHRGRDKRKHKKRNYHSKDKYGRSRITDSKENNFVHSNYHDSHDRYGNHPQPNYKNRNQKSREYNYHHSPNRYGSLENNHNEVHYHDPHYHDQDNGLVSHNKNGDHVVHHHYDSVEKHNDNRHEKIFARSQENTQSVNHYFGPKNGHSHVSYYRQGKGWQDESRSRNDQADKLVSLLSKKDYTRTKPKKIRSPIVKSLLRVANDIQCDAKEECEDDCDQGDDSSNCQDECQQNFECQEEKEIDMCEQDECAESKETDNPSTRGIQSAEFADVGCIGCRT